MSRPSDADRGGDLLWAWGGSEPAPERPRSRLWAAAAALLAALSAAAWMLAPRGGGSASPAVAPSRPDAPVAAGDAPRGIHPGRGVLLVLDRGASARTDWKAPGELLVSGLSGALAADLPPGIRIRVLLGGAELEASGAAFAVAPSAPAAASLFREALAAGTPWTVSVTRGEALWKSPSGEARIREGEVWDGESRRDPAAATRLRAFAEAWERSGWTQVPGLPLRRDSPSGMGSLLLGEGPLPAAYEMEVELDLPKAGGGGGLVYAAEGRLPVCMSPGAGVHRLRVLVGPAGVEIRIDGRLAQVLPDGAVAGASTFESGLSGPGIVFWESGIEVRSWRFRPL